MKKWKKRYIVITAIIFCMACVATIVFAYNAKFLSVGTVGIIRWILVSILFLIIAAISIYFIIDRILVMKRCLHNIKKCDDEIFRNIEQYKKCWREDKEYYIRLIQIINLYYIKDGKVDELVKKGEIDRLYARADFLQIQNTLYDNMMTCFYSLGMSFITSLFFQMMVYKNVLFIFICIIATVLAFFGIILIRYEERGYAGSYRYFIDEYERNLLLKKIDDLQQTLVIDVDDEQILETKQNVLNELIRIRQDRKFKNQIEKVESDIKKVGQLNLFIRDYSEYFIQKIYVNRAACYLVYDLERGKENNYIGELNLINQEYSILYQILNRYGLISYCQKEK